MIEYMVVDTAASYPQACLCGSSKGPFVDTNIMIDAQRRWYICKLCVKRAARPFAFMPGTEVDRLENVSEVITAKEKEIAQSQKRIEKQTASNAELSRRLEEQKALSDHYQGLCEQYRHMAGILAENAREMVSTANGGV